MATAPPVSSKPPKKNSSPVLGEVVEDRRGQWPMAIREDGETGETGEIREYREI